MLEKLTPRAATSGGAARRFAYAVLLPRYLLTLAILAFAYVCFAKVGFALAFATKQVTAVWPPTGIAVAALLLCGYRIWPGVWVGAFIGNAISDEPLLTAAGIATGNTLGPLLAAFLLRRFVGFEIALARLRDVLSLVLFGAALAMCVTATNGVLNLALAGIVPWSAAASVWWVWWAGDAMGVLLVAPMILTWAADPRVRWHKTKLLELTLLVAAVIAVGWFSFTGSLPIAYPLFPIIIWSALRFGQRETASAIIAICAIAIWGTVHDQGPFASGSLDQRLILLVTFMAVLGVTALLLGAATAERRRAEDRLCESEDRFRRVVEASPSALVMTDQEGRIVLVNARTEQVFGYSREEILGQPVEMLIPKHFRANHIGHGAGYHHASQVRAMCSGLELYGLRKDGSRFPVLWSAAPLRDAQGNAQGVVCLAQDITEINRAKEDLSDSLALRQGMLTAALDCVVAIDRGGRIIEFNAAAERTFGYRREDAIGRQMAGLIIPPRYREAHAAGFKRFLDTGHSSIQGKRIEMPALRADATEFPAELTVTAVSLKGTTVFIAYLRDITARKAAEAALVAAKEEAEFASRAKSEFLSQMSHELRTPLNAVMGFAQMLQLDRDRTLSERQKEYCQDILRGGHNLLELINELLDLSRIETGQVRLSVERVAVGDVLAQIRATMNPLAIEAGVRLELSQAAGVPDVRADDLRLRQILLNLVSNAIKYNQKGGSVLMTALAAPADRVRIIIADTGVGIAREQQDKLFTPFNRLGAEYTAIEGTGIGLALSKKLVEAMDGTIGFTSKPGEGSTFWIELPAETAEAPATRPSVSEALGMEKVSRATAGGYSLLYVEDNPASLRLMEHLVSTLPNVVMLAAPTPQLGLDLARAHRPDVIVLDLNLPDMDGFQVLARLKAAPETRDAPVIALTAAAMPKDVKKALAAGFFRYVTKPIDVKTFFAAVDDALSLPAARRANGSR